MEKINVKIIIDKQTNKFVEVTMDKNAKLRDLLSEASKSENMKDISYFKLAMPDGNLAGPESLDKTINELGFKDKSCECRISPYTLDNNKQGKDKWKGWLDLQSISLSQDKKNEDAEKNEDDSITLIIFKFSTEVTRLNVTKNTTMKDIKEQLQQKYDLSDERINELDLVYDGDNIFDNLNKTVEQIFDKNEIKEREVKAQARDFDFELKKSDLKKSENEASDGVLDIFLLLHDFSGDEKRCVGNAKKNITVIDLINDNWKIFKNFSEGFIIVVNSEEITGESNLEKQLTTLENGSSITVYLAGSATCKGKSLIKINENNYPLARIIICVIDLLLLAAAITTFLLYFLTTLSFSIAVPIVLTVLCVAFTILLFAWNKILPESWRKPPEVIKTNVTGEYDKSKQNEKGNKIIENDMQTEKNESEENNKITQLSD